MKPIARVTLIVSHDELTGDQPFQPLTTLELVTDLLGESYDFNIDVIDAWAQPMTLIASDDIDTDLTRRRREMDARLAAEREQRNKERSE